MNTERWIRLQRRSLIRLSVLAAISGPVPLPTEVQKYTILRAVHKYKDSREQFEMRTHKRLIDINNPSKETIDALGHLDLPSGVDIQIKTLN